MYKFLHFPFQEYLKRPVHPQWEDDIKKDLHRQFPAHEMFTAKGGHGYVICSLYCI
jgi:hypothetical protein